MRHAAGLALLTALAVPARAAGQEPERAWEFAVTAFWFPTADPGFLLPIATADRDALHLEARWNYEDLDTFSGWAGWTFETGGPVTLAVTPMVGVLLGNTSGIAPGVEISLAWKNFELYSENELVEPFDGTKQAYFYNWSEFVWHASLHLRAGLSVQRLRSNNSDLALDRGPVIGWELGGFSLSGYAYNPFSESAFFVLGAGFTF